MADVLRLSSSGVSLEPGRGIILEKSSQWLDWITQVRHKADVLDAWDLIDPDEDEQPTDRITEPVIETEEQVRQRLIASLGPNDPRPTLEQVASAHTRSIEVAQLARKERVGHRLILLATYVEQHVNQSAYTIAKSKLIEQGKLKPTVRQTLKQLKQKFAPNKESTKEEIRRAYRAVLQDAYRSNTKPQEWLELWNKELVRGMQYNIPEVQGTSGVKDFLRAVKHHFLPSWAENRLEEVIEKERSGEKIGDLDAWGDRFEAAYMQLRPAKHIPVYATLGGVSDDQAQVQPQALENGKAQPKCPCKRTNHPYSPNDCYFLEYALTGSSQGRKLNKEHCQRIRKELQKPHFKQLKAQLAEKGWDVSAKGKSSANNNSNTSGTGTTSLPADFNAMMLDPSLIYGKEEAIPVFATLSSPLHPLAKSTLLDTGGASHIVNSISMLDHGTFVANDRRHVEAGTGTCRIIGTGQRTLPAFFTTKGGATHNLVLSDVNVIEGFHTNIVSESKLLACGVWYCGLDCSLRLGNQLDDNQSVRKLERHFDVLFLEYKPLSNYSHGTIPMLYGLFPLSHHGIQLRTPPLRPRNDGRLPYRPSRDPKRPREDSASLWHLRAGHCGKDALQALVHNVRNVKINGIPWKDCDTCGPTQAHKVISRRASEHRSPRPFWRIHWDLQDMPEGFDGSQRLLVIRDEYSGWLYARCLPDKRATTVLNALVEFDAWVRTQFGLRICKMGSDNERAVIHELENGALQKWARIEGVVLERAPTNTHEPNGAAEQAGKQVVDKSNAMLNGASLSGVLWVESAPAAVYLINMTPTRKHQWKSPLEVLETWFRYYAPLPIREHDADLRPDWSAVYAYGCRAYPLAKDREAGRDKRLYKVSPRGHIGYLVGYVASNIYRIWIPRLERIITTRNVTFNEHIFYNPQKERSEEQSKAVIAEWITEIELDDEEEPIKDCIVVIPVQAESPGLDSGVRAPQSSEKQLESAKTPEHAPVQTAAGGLQTPKETPEPNTSAQVGSGGHAHMSREEPIEQNPEVHNLETGPDLAEQSQGNLDARPEEEEAQETTSPPATSIVVVHSADRSETIEARPSRSPSRAERRREARESARAQSPERRSARIQRLQESGPTYFDRKTHERRRGRRPGNTQQAVLLPDHQGRAWKRAKEVISCYSTLVGALNRKRSARAERKSAPQKNSISMPKDWKPGQVPKFHRDELPPPPKSWTELQKHPLKPLFMEALHKEADSLQGMGTWREIKLSDAKSKALPLKWVFTYKFDKDGMLERCKARLCVRGDLQESATLESTYAATLAARSFRIAMALAAQFDLEIKQQDIKNAFVNAYRSTLGVPVTCAFPPGLKEGKEGMCLELDRALYGLRDSPQLWFKTFSASLREMGLEASKEEPCLFYTKARDAFVIFFVDDILILYHQSNRQTGEAIMKGIRERYDLSDKGDAEWFLGIKIIRERSKRKIYLSHESYIEKIAARFNLNAQASFPSIPIPVQEYRMRHDQATAAEIKEYQEKVGSLLYTAIMIRPDVAFAASLLSRFLTNPSNTQMRAVDQAIRYLYLSKGLSLQFGRSTGIQALLIASDASFADDLESRRSSQGYLITLFGGPIAWKAARQQTVATSTTEAELLAMQNTAKETMSLKRLFKELRFESGSRWNINCDNLQTIRLVMEESTRLKTNLRHVDIHNMWLKQEHKNGSFEITYLQTGEMPADGLTKTLSRQRFEHFVALLNLVNSEGINVT